MHRVFQSLIDGLADSTDATDLQNVLAQAGGALDLSCFGTCPYHPDAKLPKERNRLFRVFDNVDHAGLQFADTGIHAMGFVMDYELDSEIRNRHREIDIEGSAEGQRGLLCPRPRAEDLGAKWN